MKKVINGKMYNTGNGQKRWPTGTMDTPVTLIIMKKGYTRRKQANFSSLVREEQEANTAITMGLKHMALARLSRIPKKRPKKWAEKHCSGDEYEEIFGEVEE